MAHWSSSPFLFPRCQAGPLRSFVMNLPRASRSFVLFALITSLLHRVICLAFQERLRTLAIPQAPLTANVLSLVLGRLRVFGHPGLAWSGTSGAGGHKQVRMKFAIIKHWNTGVVNVQGRDAHIASRQLLSTRPGQAPDSVTPSSSWQPSRNRRKRNTHLSPPSGAPSCSATPSSPTDPFSSPYCGTFSALSPPTAEPVETLSTPPIGHQVPR